MKSIFTKLSTLLLCGVVAMVGCTDFSEDIQAVDKKVDDLTSSTQTELASLKSAITDLEAKLAAQYATKDEVAALKTALENSIASEVDALSKDIADVNAALKAAEDKINGAIADLDDKKADKTAVDAAIKTATEAIAALQSQLEAAKGELEAEIDEVKAEIAATEEELAAQIGAVDAKANELHNTLLALSDYLANLEAKVNELKGTLDALSEYLPKMKAELEEKINAVDAKAIENYNTLLALSDHLAEYEATTDFKLVELQGSLAALSVYLEEYEASVDAKFKEILNTFDSLDGFLDEKFAALEATDTDLYKEIEGIRVVLTTLNNLLADEVADRTAEDAAIYELIGTSVTALNNLIADLAAQDDAIYVEMENIRTYVAQVYNSLSYEIQAVDAALKAHVAAFEAYKTEMQKTIESLYANDSSIAESVADHARKIHKYIDEKVAELQAQDDELWTKVFEVEKSLSQAMNYLLTEMDDRDNALYAKVSEDIQTAYGELNSMIELTQEALTVALKDIADLFEMVQTNAAAIAKLETAVEILNSWAEAHQDEYDDLVQLVTKHVADLTAQIEALNEKDLELEANIGETSKALSALIEDTEKRFGEIEVYIKENFDLQGAAIRNLENILNDLSAELGARLDALEGRVDNIEIDIATLEEQAASMQEAIEGINETIETLKEMDEALADEIAKVDADAKAALKEARKDLQDQIDALVEAKEDLQVRVTVLEQLVADNKDAIENNSKEIAANVEAISKIYTQLGSIQGTVNAMIQSNAIIHSALQAKDAELAESINEVKADLATALGRIGALEDALNALEELAATLASKLEFTDSEIKRIEDKADAIQNMLLTMITAAEDRANDKINHLRELVSEADELIKELRGDVNDLLARVQSMVYVPEYDDHKAPIYYAELYSGKQETARIMKKSVLRYRVYAVAGESAEQAAADIADAWGSETFDLYYEVEPVKRYYTRTAAPAALNIVDVEAKGEFVYVTVLAENFRDSFFYSFERTGDNEIEVEDEDVDLSYSAALVLSDGNNNRSTEYTALAPATPEFIEAIVVDSLDTNISFTSDSEPVNLLPYDLDPEEVAVLKGHALAFSVGEDLYSAAELIEQGYDIQLDRRQHFTYPLEGGPQSDYDCDGKHQDIDLGVGDVKFRIQEKDFVSEIEEKDTYVTLTRALKKEEYKSLKEKKLIIKFLYNVNGVEVWAESAVEICNRLVTVNLSVDVPWTLETALSTIADSKMYEGPVTATFEYDLAKAANKPLEGYSLSAIVHQANNTGSTSYVPKCPITMGISDETITAILNHGSKARYEFPKNNNDDVVDYNSYTVTKKAEFDDLTVTVNVTMRLGEQAPHQYLNKEVKFTTEAGANGWLFGYWNALEDAYQKFLADGYIGYVDAPETGKAKFFEAFAQTSSYGNMGAMPVVNGKTGIPQNVNIPFTANNNEAGEHKFQLWHEQLGLTPEQPYVDGTKHTILQSVKPYFQIPFTFTVNGTVDLPDYALDLDPVRVLNRGNEKIVNVYGEISKETNKYTVDVSDLAKYYYVVNKEGTKSLVNANNDVVTVDFTLSPMAGAEETGYNFNAVADDTDYTLTVDWTKAEPYILPMSEAVVNWGTYPHTEVGVNAILNVNGFPIVAKPITLVTADPLEIALNDVTVEVTHLSGTNADPIVAKVYQNFVLTSAVEEGNLFNNNAKTIGGLWYYSKADNTYGVTMDLKFNRVYYKENNEKVGWDESKIVLEKYTAENVVAPYEVGDLTGNVWIRPDDGDIQVPIYVEFDVVMNHRIHDASKTTCETKGTVTVKFVPEGYVEVAE